VSRKSFPGLAMAALGVLAGVAALQAARAEPASPLKPAISDNATANSQKKQTLAAAISNAAVARGARRGGDGRDAARRARDSFGADMGSGLVGGSFAWPYYSYCMRHPGDQNC
jgi:hypothetical protein